MPKLVYSFLAVSMIFLAPGSAAGQSATDEVENAIVVTAKRSGAPMWTITTSRGAVLLVGEISEVPKSAEWRPDRLEYATMRAQRVILGTKTKISPGDILRLVFRGGKITKLPKGKVARDYLSTSQYERLLRLEARFDKDYSRSNFLMTAIDLLSKRLEFSRGTGPDATDVVRKAARRAGIASQPVATVRGEDVIDNLFAASPDVHIDCLDAAMAAAEVGQSIVDQRGADWRDFDIPAVMANPLEEAIGQCWPWADATLGADLRQQWVDAVSGAMLEEGITLAVVPLRVLAEKDGLLDQLSKSEARIDGPAWRSDLIAEGPTSSMLDTDKP